MNIEIGLIIYLIVYFVVVVIWAWQVSIKEVMFHPLINLAILIGLFLFLIFFGVILSEAIKVIK